MTKRFSAIIVDDEPTAREILRTHLERTGWVDLCGEFKNAIEALSFLKVNHVDVVFLDINMPEVSGLAFGKLIQKEVKLIFTTAHREYAVEGFDMQAVDYLLKPISFERLLQAIHKFQGQQTKANPTSLTVYENLEASFVFVRADRRMVKIDFDSLIYVESLSDYIKIHTTSGTVVTRETISNFQTKIPPEHFLRTHRSFIVAASSIDSYSNEEIVVGSKSIPISRSYKDAVLSFLERFKI
ncbi:MAG: LytTR family DNA-binding domain-containing protein [Leeuwenhoekiella sp.]